MDPLLWECYIYNILRRIERVWPSAAGRKQSGMFSIPIQLRSTDTDIRTEWWKVWSCSTPWWIRGGSCEQVSSCSLTRSTCSSKNLRDHLSAITSRTTLVGTMSIGQRSTCYGGLTKWTVRTSTYTLSKSASWCCRLIDYTLTVFSLTQATDTSNIRLVFAAVKETILQNALKDSGILWWCRKQTLDKRHRTPRWFSTISQRFGWRSIYSPMPNCGTCSYPETDLSRICCFDLVSSPLHYAHFKYPLLIQPAA